MPDRAQLERHATELLRRLIRFNTVNPPGNEQECQEFLKRVLERAGFDVQLLAAVEGRPNLVARLPSGKDGPVLCMLGHVTPCWRIQTSGSSIRGPGRSGTATSGAAARST